MKISVISKYGSVPGSGTLTRLFYIAKYLQKSGHTVEYVISDSNHLGKGLDGEKIACCERSTGVKVKVLKLLKYRNQDSVGRLVSWLQFEAKLIKHLLFNKADLLLVSSPSIFSIITGVLFKKLHKSKLVVDIRDIWPMTLIEEGGISPNHPLMKFMDKIQLLGYKKADLVLSSIPDLSTHVKELTGLDKKFHCLPMGYDPVDDRISETSSNLKASSNLDPTKVTVGYVGSMGPTNNLNTFFEMIKSITNPKVQFLVVGDGSLFEKFKAEVDGQSNVVFTGRVTKAEAREYTQICDLVYFSTHKSSIWKYGQSLNKVLDYMLLGKPIVAAYPKFGFRTMINESGCGHFIESDNLSEHIDMVDELANMEVSDLQKLGAAGKEWVLENRSYEKLVGDFEKELKHV